jgi:hypothetical protein
MSYNILADELVSLEGRGETLLSCILNMLGRQRRCKQHSRRTQQQQLLSGVLVFRNTPACMLAGMSICVKAAAWQLAEQLPPQLAGHQQLLVACRTASFPCLLSQETWMHDASTSCRFRHLQAYQSSNNQREWCWCPSLRCAHHACS